MPYIITTFSPLLVSREMPEEYKEKVKNILKEGNKMAILEWFQNYHGIKFVKEDSIFPGKNNYLFYKSGKKIFVEICNITEEEFNNPEYQKIIVEEMKKAWEMN